MFIIYKFKLAQYGIGMELVWNCGILWNVECNKNSVLSDCHNQHHVMTSLPCMSSHDVCYVSYLFLNGLSNLPSQFLKLQNQQSVTKSTVEIDN